jgi:hypothetical protein
MHPQKEEIWPFSLYADDRKHFYTYLAKIATKLQCVTLLELLFPYHSPNRLRRNP